MTIIAGFRCKKGVVLCADTQETVGNVSKRNVPKLRFERTPRVMATLGGTDLAAVFCGATDNGAFVDKLVDSAWVAARTQHSIEDVSAAIECSIKDTYREFGEIYQLGYCPYAELIYGVKVNGESRLFAAAGPVVNKKDEYCTGGVGTYMADFLAERMYDITLTIQQCVILAAYILFQAKEHVDGCGGKSHIAILREDAPSGFVDSRRIESITENLEKADRQIGRPLLASSNLDLSDKEFRKEANDVFEVLEMFRSNQKEDFKKWENFTEQFNALFGISNKVDSFGIFVPSDDGKLEHEESAQAIIEEALGKPPDREGSES